MYVPMLVYMYRYEYIYAFVSEYLCMLYEFIYLFNHVYISVYVCIYKYVCICVFMCNVCMYDCNYILKVYNEQCIYVRIIVCSYASKYSIIYVRLDMQIMYIIYYHIFPLFSILVYLHP